jgi:hypothetical protein
MGALWQRRMGNMMLNAILSTGADRTYAVPWPPEIMDFHGLNEPGKNRVNLRSRFTDDLGQGLEGTGEWWVRSCPAGYRLASGAQTVCPLTLPLDRP